MQGIIQTSIFQYRQALKPASRRLDLFSIRLHICGFHLMYLEVWTSFFAELDFVRGFRLLRDLLEKGLQEN